MSRMPRFFRHRAPLLLVGSLVLAVSACSGSHSQSAPTPAGKSDSSSSVGSDKSGSKSAVDTPAAVNAGYNGYAKAVTTKAGPAVASTVSQSSLNYFARLRDLALSSTDLTQESPVDQVTVLTMRGRIAAATLRKDTPQQLIEAGVQNGLISSPSGEGLKDIKVSGQIANAVLVLPGSKTQYPVWLHLEQGQWKFDLSSLLGPAESALTQAKAAAPAKDKTNESALVKSVLVTRFGAAKAAQLYRPLGK